MAPSSSDAVLDRAHVPGMVRSTLASLMVAAALARATGAEETPAGDAVVRFKGRGVYYVMGRIRCPLAGVGTRAPDASNRIALDDDATEAIVDRARHRITLENARRYATRTLIGDVLLLGTGKTASGRSLPFGVHLKVEKEGTRFRTRVHPHPTSREAVVQADLEPFDVVVSDGKTETRALDEPAGVRAIREPELTARLANLFLQVEDHIDRRPIVPGETGSRLVDLTIGYGVPKMNLKVARVQVVSLEAANASLVERGALAEMLGHGAWELRLAPASVPLPKEEFDRDLFLFGMDDVALLAPLKTRGLGRGQSLVIGYRDGRGYVGLGDRRADIPNPADVARSYLEFHLLGGIIAQQITTLPDRLAASSRPRDESSRKRLENEERR